VLKLTLKLDQWFSFSVQEKNVNELLHPEAAPAESKGLLLNFCVFERGVALN